MNTLTKNQIRAFNLRIKGMAWPDIATALNVSQEAAYKLGVEVFNLMERTEKQIDKLQAKAARQKKKIDDLNAALEIVPSRKELDGYRKENNRLKKELKAWQREYRELLETSWKLAEKAAPQPTEQQRAQVVNDVLIADAQTGVIR